MYDIINKYIASPYIYKQKKSHGYLFLWMCVYLLEKIKDEIFDEHEYEDKR